MTYGLETQTMSKVLEMKSRSTGRGTERSILRITIIDMNNSKWITKWTGINYTIKAVQTKKW